METMEFRDVIRTRRHELGLSQVAVSERVGMSQEWYSRIERGGNKGALKTDLLMRLADALEMRYDTLAIAAGIVQTAHAAAALREYHRRNQRDRDRLDEIHGRLDEHLLRLSKTQIDALVQTAEMWAEAAEIRQAADPAPNGTSPQSPQTGPAPASPDPAAPESAGSGSGR